MAWGVPPAFGMKWPQIAILAAAAVFAAPAAGQRNAKMPVNVNSRYTVESVQLEGVDKETFSESLRKDIDRLIGQRFDQSLLNALIDRMKNEVRIRSVEQRLAKGSQPASIKIVLEVHRRRNDIDLDTPKLAYHSREGWTGAIDGTVKVGNQYLGGGVQSDGSTLVERFAGANAHYEWRPLGSPRVRMRFDWEGFHETWNTATREAVSARGDVPGLYRGRQNLVPSVAFQLTHDLTATAGMSFEDIDFELPAARGQWSNAVVTTLRLHHRWNDDIGPNSDDLEAGYTLRAATRTLSSDFVFARHNVSLAYGRQRGHVRLDIQARAGSLSGRAPLYERFVLGNTQTLRGWSKWDLAPAGADHYEYASVQAAYRFITGFYDTGATWDKGAAVQQRHAAGFGFCNDDLLIAVGFPLRNGRHDPVFYMAVKF